MTDALVPRHGSFEDFQPLSPAEIRVVTGLGSGEFERVGEAPDAADADPARTVRAELLRFLIVGGDSRYRLHEKGLRISGAIVTGILDLEGCRIERDLGLRDCQFEATPVLRSAIIDSLFLDGSNLPGLRADRLQARGVVSMRGAVVTGAVRLGGGRLGGSFEADGASFATSDGWTIDADSLEARGGFLLRGARVTGGINVAAIRLGGDLSISGSQVTRPGEIALNGEGASARGDMSLKSSRIEGEVRLWGAQFNGNVDCTSARLSQPEGNALSLNRARVEGVFFLHRAASIHGKLDLTACSLGAIHDEAASWPEPGDLLLNRCRYGAIIGGPVDAGQRLDWLSRQPFFHTGEEFWPEPYEQLALVLLGMGHEDDSRAVLIEKERLQRRARRTRARNPLLRWALAAQDGILAVTLRYGRQPLYAFIWLGLFWATGTVVFGVSERNHALKPNSAVVLRSLEWTMCSLEQDQTRYMPTAGQVLRGRAAAGQSQLACFLEQPEAMSYPEFNPFMYSLDTLLPVTELGQKEYWRPDPRIATGAFSLAYYYLQSVIGWSLSLLAVAGFSGLVKSR